MQRLTTHHGAYRDNHMR